jgi:hypothetical protein
LREKGKLRLPFLFSLDKVSVERLVGILILYVVPCKFLAVRGLESILAVEVGFGRGVLLVLLLLHF